MKTEATYSEQRPINFAKEVIANQLSRVATMLVQFLTAPFVAAMVGPTSYGLVGFYVTLAAFLAFLTQAPSSIATRILAPWPTLSQLSQKQTKAAYRLLERAALVTGLLVTIVLLLATPWLVDHWFALPSSDRSSNLAIVALIAITIGAQWPHPFFTAAFSALGAQRKIALPLFIFSVLQNGGGILLMYSVAPRLEIYFAWTAAAWALFNIYCHIALKPLLSSSEETVSSALTMLRAYRGFAWSVTAYALLSAATTQIDKFVVSYANSLAEFAAYVMSFTLASLIMAIAATPVGSVLLPIIARHRSSRDETALARDYHLWTQVLMVLALPPAATFITFPQPIAELWLGASSPLVPEISRILPWAAASVLCLAATSPPLLLQWGHGWTSLSVTKIIVALPLYLGMLVWLVPSHGAVAAAWCAFVAQLAILAFEVPIMHARLLRGELMRWLLISLGRPIITAIGFYALAAPLVYRTMTGILLPIGVVAFTAMSVIVLVYAQWGKKALTVLNGERAPI